MVKRQARKFFVAWCVLLVGSLVVAGMVSAQPVAEEPRERQLGERVLAMGSWGADVFTLQRNLRRLGFDLAADGLYGPITRDAVSEFQSHSGLNPTGRFDARTLEALNRALLTTVSTMEYVVVAGDSLWTIARAFSTQMEVIVALNDLPDRPLRIGERLKVPAMPNYTVKTGDTLWGIARTHRTTIAAIAELNGLDPQAVLRPGTVLRLPRDAFVLPPGMTP